VRQVGAADPAELNEPTGASTDSQSHSTAPGVAILPRFGKRQDWLWGLLLVIAIFLAYQRAWHAGFIWDDDSHLTQNPHVIGPLGFKEIWTTAAARICPLVLSSFRVEYMLWGLNPLPYHLVNIGVHAACAILLWQVLQRLRVPGAWLGAALWALHPVQVETVAWITELKNTQSCLFYLLATLFFLKWHTAGGMRIGQRSHREWTYALTLLFAALAMASKSSTVILPLVLGLCAWWIDRRWHWRNLRSLAPFLLLTVLASAWTMWTQEIEGGNDPLWIRSGPERLVTAGKVVWFYLDKLLIPHPLIFIYPRWEVDASKAASFLASLAVCAVLFILWWNRQGRLRSAFFAFAYFLVALLPVLGLVEHFFLRYSFVGDHFQYLASIGPLALAAAGATTAFGFIDKKAPLLKPALFGALLTLLGILTWRQGAMYSDDETLWQTTIRRNPASWMAYNNLATILLEKGQVDEAISHYRKALEIRSVDAMPHYNLGDALLRKGEVNAAISLYYKALELAPDSPATHINLGNVLLKQGQVDNAISHYRRALEIWPDDPAAHNNLGNALVKKGLADEAISHYQKALKSKPDYAQAHDNLSNALLAQGRINEAISGYQKALEIKAADPFAHNNLGNALVQKGQLDEAIYHCQKALELRPNYAEAHLNLGNALFQKREVNAAISHYRKALEITPSAKSHNNLGYALFQQGKRDEAMTEYGKALELQPDYEEALYNLGVGFQRNGQAHEALAHYQRALAIKPGYVQAQNNLAWMLATSPEADVRNGPRAVELAQEANQTTGGENPSILDTLAAAYAEVGRFNEALETARRGLELAQSQSNIALADSLRNGIEHYQGKTPLRDAK